MLKLYAGSNRGLLGFPYMLQVNFAHGSQGEQELLLLLKRVCEHQGHNVIQGRLHWQCRGSCHCTFMMRMPLYRLLLQPDELKMSCQCMNHICPRVCRVNRLFPQPKEFEMCCRCMDSKFPQVCRKRCIVLLLGKVPVKPYGTLGCLTAVVGSRIEGWQGTSWVGVQLSCILRIKGAAACVLPVKILQDPMRNAIESHFEGLHL